MSKDLVFFGLVSAGLFFLPPNAVAQGSERTCIISIQKELFMKSNESIRGADAALMALSKDLQDNKVHLGGYQDEMGKLVTRGRKEFDDLINKAVRRSTDACDMCDMKWHYENAKIALATDGVVEKLSLAALKDNNTRKALEGLREKKAEYNIETLAMEHEKKGRRISYFFSPAFRYHRDLKNEAFKRYDASREELLKLLGNYKPDSGEVSA